MRILSTIMWLLLVFTASAFYASATPRNITWQDLEILEDGKIPNNAVRSNDGGLFKKGPYWVDIVTPRGAAAQFAKYAKDNFIKLDSSNFNPVRFNNYVRMDVYNIQTSSIDDVRQVKRAVLEIDGKIYEADSVEFFEEAMQNAYGAQFTNVDANFYFPLKLFYGESDIKLWIFDNKEKCDRKFKKKDIEKLE